MNPDQISSLINALAPNHEYDSNIIPNIHDIIEQIGLFAQNNVNQNKEVELVKLIKLLQKNERYRQDGWRSTIPGRIVLLKNSLESLGYETAANIITPLEAATNSAGASSSPNPTL